jgi:cell division FtsZ-interacting protein ZapD
LIADEIAKSKSGKMSASSKLGQLLETAKLLGAVEQRGVAAVLGACVADAASRPLHWVYDQTDLKRYIKGGEKMCISQVAQFHTLRSLFGE